MNTAWLLVFAAPLVVACGSDDDKSCPDVDIDSATFTPDQVQSGSSVTLTLPVTSGSPSGDCPVSASLSCGSKKQSLKVPAAGSGFETSVVLDCSDSTAPVNCSYSYSYETAGGAQVGGGSGPTCTP